MSMDRTFQERGRLAEYAWINELSDEDCMAVFWLYVDQPEPFLAAHSPELLGAAMRYALRAVAEDQRENTRKRALPSQNSKSPAPP
jgi:hypothetical protein